MSDFKMKLRWSNLKDTPLIRAAAEHCSVCTIFDVANTKLVTHEEFNALVQEGKIASGESYWGVTEGKIGLVSDAVGSSHQWELVSNAKIDFRAGWEAAIKSTKG